MSLQNPSPTEKIGRLLSLLSRHHGSPRERDGRGKQSPAEHLPSLWKSLSRRNHLQSRRRRVALEQIPTTALPAILELSGGSNFVILVEKVATHPGDAYIVQFPDSRESLVRGDRLRELYDGTCVFLSPSSGRGGGLLRPFFENLLGWNRCPTTR